MKIDLSQYTQEEINELDRLLQAAALKKLYEQKKLGNAHIPIDPFQVLTHEEINAVAREVKKP